MTLTLPRSRMKQTYTVGNPRPSPPSNLLFLALPQRRRTQSRMRPLPSLLPSSITLNHNEPFNRQLLSIPWKHTLLPLRPRLQPPVHLLTCCSPALHCKNPPSITPLPQALPSIVEKRTRRAVYSSGVVIRAARNRRRRRTGEVKGMGTAAPRRAREGESTTA